MTIGKKLVWIAEDEPSLQWVYTEILGSQYELVFMESIEKVKEALNTGKLPALFIADLKLADGSFLKFLDMPEAKPVFKVPFVVVTSLDDLRALELCFQKGAKDYITKPFGKNELLGKVSRLTSATPAPDDFSLDPTTLKISRVGRSSPTLTSKEFQILAVLKQAPDYKLPREEIVSRIWAGAHVTPKTLDVHLFNLRKKLTEIGLEVVYVPPSDYQLLVDQEKQVSSSAG